MTIEHEMLRETELRELIDKFAKQISINSDLQLGIYIIPSGSLKIGK